MKKADSLMAAEDFNQALISLDSAQLVNPSNGDIYFTRARIHLLQSEPRAAIDDLGHAIEHDPTNHKAFALRADIRYLLGDHRNYSLQDMDAAIALMPTNADYYIVKARYLTRTSDPYTGEPDYLLAINCITKALAIDHENAAYYNQRGLYKFEDGQRLSAISDFSKAIEIDSLNARYFNDRGLVSLLIEDYESALKDFSKAVTLDPSNADYMQKKGHTRFNQGNYLGAIDDFTLAINALYRKIENQSGRISADHPLNIALRRTYLFRGSAYKQMDVTYKACEDFKVARTLGDPKAPAYLSRYCH